MKFHENKSIYLATLKKKNLWLCSVGFPLVVTSRGYSPVAAHRRPLAVAPPVAVLALGHAGSAVWATGFSCSEACGIFPDQGLNLWLLHWQADSLSRATREVLSYVFNTYAYTVYLFISSVKVCHLGGLCLRESPRCSHFVSHYQ